MPPELNLRLETGRIIEGEQEINSFIDINIKSPPQMQINELNVWIQ